MPKVPLIIRKLPGFQAAMESLNAAAKAAKLPPVWRGGITYERDYSLSWGAPMGNPRAYPLFVTYKSRTDKEQRLGPIMLPLSLIAVPRIVEGTTLPPAPAPEPEPTPEPTPEPEPETPPRRRRSAAAE